MTMAGTVGMLMTMPGTLGMPKAMSDMVEHTMPDTWHSGGAG